MRHTDIQLGKIYRLKSSPTYGYIKPVEIIPKGTIIKGVKSTVILVKCHHNTSMDMDSFAFVRYFMPRDIVYDETRYTIYKGDDIGGWSKKNKGSTYKENEDE